MKILTQYFSQYLIFIISIMFVGCSAPEQSGQPISPNKALETNKLLKEQKKPNIIVIYTDDMNFSDAGVFGGKVLTPTIDKLAQQGAKLNRYYANSPVCSPSRYNILTGRYASYSHSLRDQYPKSEPAFLRWNTHIEEEDTTIAELLKDSGYVTGMVGKYHNFDNEAVQLPNSEDSNARDIAVAKRIKTNYQNAIRAIKQTTEFDHIDRIYANNLHALALPKELQHHNQEWITEGALNFIDKNYDKPFYLYLATTTPHVPAPVLSMKADPRITPQGYLAKAPQVQASRESVFARTKQAGLPEEAAVMLWIDDAITSIINKLSSHNLLDNTLIIFASDHSGAHGGRGKMTNYEGGVNTPALVWWPDKIKPQQVNRLVSAVDIVPTILEAAGVNDEKITLDGKSMLPLLTGKVDKLRDEAYLEITYTRGLVTEKWKYIAVRFPSKIQKDAQSNPGKYNQEGLLKTNDALAGIVRSRYNAHELHPHYFDFDQLYNLEQDPKEQHNLANNPEYASILTDLKKRLSLYVTPMPHDFGEFKKSTESKK
ncbi:sulfatase family protein [Catenovulum sediminis]|uniref:Sulfatase-like hydrolase/transferase n=1 Tax=Catenovulum sediminis TaxID=1740262 RepID=A0ABV1RFW9_9ALTE